MMKYPEFRISDLYFLVPFILILVIWTLVSTLGIVNPVLISNPVEVFRTITELMGGQTPNGHSVLLTQMYASYYRLVVSFLIAACVGICFGILMGTSRIVNWFFDPVLTLLMPIPGIAWAPIFMIWIGFGDNTIITVSALAAFFPIVYNTSAGVRHINMEYVWAARSMGAGRLSLFRSVYIPFSSVHIYTGLKLGLARGWRTVIAVEMLAATMWGLGFMIFDAREYLLPSVIYAGIVITAVTFYMLEHFVIRWCEERTIIRWGMLDAGDV
jgi:ABC-type nitrate/sulfonate/bicarbonate transport system permease component